MSTTTSQSFHQPVNPLAYAIGEGNAEADRLNRQHALLTDLFGGLSLAPVRDPRSILDAGTGTEIWATEMASTYPNATVVGVDLREEPGIPRNLPHNYRYVQGNFLEGLPFNDGSFDYVHLRAVWSAMAPEKWPITLRELARVTKPGGWIESVEGGLTHIFDASIALSTYTGWVRQLLRQRGVEADYVAKLPFDVLALSPALVTKVVFFTQGIPYGKQYGPLGAANEANLLEACSSLKDPIVSAGLTTGKVFDQITQQMQSELVTAKCMAPVYVLYAQRV
jgi:SAM-dependent methyltransferase